MNVTQSSVRTPSSEAWIHGLLLIGFILSIL